MKWFEFTYNRPIPSFAQRLETEPEELSEVTEEQWVEWIYEDNENYEVRSKD